MHIALVRARDEPACDESVDYGAIRMTRLETERLLRPLEMGDLAERSANVMRRVGMAVGPHPGNPEGEPLGVLENLSAAASAARGAELDG